MIDGVQVFSATLARERESLGDRVNDWLATAKVDVVDLVLEQSSDESYHCTTIVVFYRRRA